MVKPWVTAQQSWDFGSAQPKVWIDGDLIWIKEFAESPRSVWLVTLGEVTLRIGVLDPAIVFFDADGAQITRVCLSSSSDIGLAEGLIESIRNARPTTSGVAKTTFIADEIQRLADLRASGALSEEEFAAIKRRLLEAPAADPSARQPGGSCLETDAKLNATDVRQIETPAASIQDADSVPKKRNLGFGLFMGIAVFPYVFTWFTLRKGHSLTARIFAFGWLVFSFSLFSSDPLSKSADSLPRLANEQASLRDCATSYTVVGEPYELSYPAADRLWMGIRIPEGRTEEEIRATLANAARTLGKRKGVDALQVGGFGAKDEFRQVAYTLGRATWAPNGRWKDATKSSRKAVGIQCCFGALPTEYQVASDAHAECPSY